MTDEFLENLGLEISLPETPAEENKADSVEEQEKVETPKEVETKVEEVAPEKDSQQEELERLRKENENLNKRLKDTQRSLTKKSEELKSALKKEVEDSTKEDNADYDNDDDDDDDWFSDSSEEDADVKEEKSQGDSNLKELQNKIHAQEEKLRELEEYTQQQQQSQALNNWQKAEAPVKEKYPDYAEIVDGPFLEAINNGDETSAWLMSEFRKEGSTPEAAYKVAKKYCDYIGYKAKSVTTDSTDKSNLHKTRISDDPDFNSAPPDNKDNNDKKEWDPLDSFYATR